MVYGINKFIHLIIPLSLHLDKFSTILYLKKASSARRCKKVNILCLPNIQNTVHKEMYCMQWKQSVIYIHMRFSETAYDLNNSLL